MNVYEENYLLRKKDTLHNDIIKNINSLNKIIQTNIDFGDELYEQFEKIYLKIKIDLNKFEKFPNFLEPKLDDFIKSLSDSFILLYSKNDHLNIFQFSDLISKLVYEISKICHFKKIPQYFSCDVYKLPKIFNLLKYLQNNENSHYDIFLCLLWLSTLILVPFKLNTIEHNIGFEILKVALNIQSKCNITSINQFSSLILISNLLTRSDYMEDNLLNYFFFDIVEPEWKLNLDKNFKEKLSYLMSINLILKKLSHKNINTYIDLIFDCIKIDILNLRNKKKEISTVNSLQLELFYTIKIASKLSNFFLKNLQYNKVVEIINIVYEIMCLMIEDLDSKLRYQISKSFGKIIFFLSKTAINYQNQMLFFTIDFLKISNFNFLHELTNDGVIKYQFNTDINFNKNEVSINKYHITLLTLGFVILNKSLPNFFIPIITSILHKTLFFKRKKLSIGIGNQIRESSCFIIWSLSKVLNLNNFILLFYDNKFMMESILFDLICLTIFDDDLTIRRCGIATLQEFSGRFGNFLFSEINKDKDVICIYKFVLDFIQCFDLGNISTKFKSLCICEQLIQIGFEKNLFVFILLDKLIDKYCEESFENKKLYCFQLKKILSIKTENELYFYNFNFLPKYDSIKSIIEELNKKKNNLFFVAELITLVNRDQVKEIIDLNTAEIEKKKFDIQKTSHEEIESFLNWVNYLIENDINFSENFWENIYTILRLKSSNDLINLFKKFFDLLKKKENLLTNEVFQNLLEYLDTSEILSHTMLNCVSKNFQMTAILKTMSNFSVNANIRSNLINLLNVKFESINTCLIDKKIFFDFLNDYTTTNQGDVGSIVRFSTLQFLKNNIDFFKDYLNEIELFLIVLSGQLIEKIRFFSLNFIFQINKIKKNLNPRFINNSAYYKILFNYFENEILQNPKKRDENHINNLLLCFWEGISFSIGSFKGDSSLINISFIQMLKTFRNIDDLKLTKVFNCFLSLLKSPNPYIKQKDSFRIFKTQNGILKIILNLLDSEFEFPKSYDYNSLFVKCYNLLLNSKSAIRIGLVLKIFQYLFINKKVLKNYKTKIIEKLSFFAFNNSAKVRIVSSQILFEIFNNFYGEESCELNFLESINWNLNSTKIKEFITEINQILLKIDFDKKYN